MLLHNNYWLYSTTCRLTPVAMVDKETIPVKGTQITTIILYNPLTLA